MSAAAGGGAGGQAVLDVDDVEGVREPQEAHERQRDRGPGRQERELDVDRRVHEGQDGDHLSRQFLPRRQDTEVVDEAEDHDDGAGQEQPQDLRGVEAQRGGEGEEERQVDRQAPEVGHRLALDLEPAVRLVDDAEADRRPAHERREIERHDDGQCEGQRRAQEGAGHATLRPACGAGPRAPRGARRSRSASYSAAVSSTRRSIGNSASTRARPALPYRSRRPGSPSRAATAAASACGSPGGTRTPSIPSRTIPRWPPTPVAPTARSIAIASRSVSPNPSQSDGWTNRSYAASRRWTSRRAPAKRTLRARSGAPARFSSPGRAGPSPARTKRALGTSAAIRAAASRNTASPFFGSYRRPRVPTTRSSGSRPSSARTAARSAGSAGAVGAMAFRSVS